jgi:molybdenum cofactor cytidylyltransferase
MLAAAILAAGESRRMGSPKALASIHGKTFVQHLLDATRHPRIGLTRIVLGADADKIRSSLMLAADSIVLNREWQLGQLSSIHAAIRSLPDGATEGLILCPVDHPLISPGLVAELIAEFDSSGKRIVLPVFHGRRGHPVVFRSDLYAELLAASPDVGARQVLWAHESEAAEIPTEEEGVVLNLNHPEILQKAEEKRSTH